MEEEDSIVEKGDSFGFSQADKTLSISNTVSGLSESLKQQIGDGSMDVQSFYKTGRPYIAASSLHMKLNSRYISKISSSPRKFQDPSIRMRPYFIPERSRTKSESTDTKHSDISSYEARTVGTEDLFTSQCDTMMDTSCDNICATNSFSNTTAPVVAKAMKNSSLKKSKSLEDIRAKVVDGSQPSHEMEFVSSRIQKLKVHD
ncbi:uncharacterized protein LOC119066383 [Bradysia coprophila]|uniref:uncharacterized protein LOC119066383 n=1 Tax=Bradysia coprophila TaxID=38358 RepID=UPI00187D7EF3|nr:uncharacterized protein LOC119066383 [Bradysia coprophila]